MTSVRNEILWAEERKEVTTAALRASKKGAKQEKEKINRGWRYVKVGNVTKILVPCDKNGNPTIDGLKRISQLKKMLGIK